MKKISLLSVICLIAIGSTSFKQQPSNTINQFKKMLEGNWEMTSRVSNGKPTNTEGNIFFNLVKSSDRFTGEQLATESGILDAFVSGGGDNKPYEIASLFTVTVSQGDNGVVLFKASGEIAGSYGPFTKGVAVIQTYTFVKKGNSFVLKSQSQTDSYGQKVEKNVESESQVYDQIMLSKDKIVFTSSTLKLIDTYARISTKGSTFGGIWNLRKAYYMFKAKLS